MTLYDGLVSLYKKYGFCKEGIKSLTLKGIEGLEKIQKIMATFRENAPTEFAGIAVTWARDYKTKVFKNMQRIYQQKECFCNDRSFNCISCFTNI